MEPFTILMLCLVFVMLVLGSLTDFKTREVPDYLSYSMIFLGIGLRLLYSVMTFNWSYLLEGIFGLGVFFLFSCALYYLGHWGGGDSKVLMAMGALIGVTLALNQFMVSFLIFLIFVGALYGLVWSIFLAFLHRNTFFPAFVKKMHDKKIIRWRAIALFLSVALIVFSFFTIFQLPLFFLAFMLLLSTPVVVFVKIVELVCMQRSVTIDKLTEGDWLVNDVFLGKKKIVAKNNIGLTKEHLTLLKKYFAKGKLKKILIKEGMPFIPAFLLAFLVTLWLGDLFFRMM